MRDLLGHTSRSLSTVETYLDVASADSGPVDLADAVAYYLAIAGALADTAAVVQRGRADGAALGEDPMAALSALVVRVHERVRAAPATALVRTPFGTMTLEGYLPTRTLELTVHTCDLAAAVGVSADVPQGAVPMRSPSSVVWPQRREQHPQRCWPRPAVFPCQPVTRSSDGSLHSRWPESTVCR